MIAFAYGFETPSFAHLLQTSGLNSEDKSNWFAGRVSSRTVAAFDVQYPAIKSEHLGLFLYLKKNFGISFLNSNKWTV